MHKKKLSLVQEPGQLDSPVEAGGGEPTKAHHEIANAFPLIEGAEFDELVADIKAHGLRNPITLFEDKILDGRNRDRACLLAGVTPLYVPLPKDSSPFDFVISTNLKRRHLTESQRGMIAAELANMQRGGDRDSKGPRDPFEISQADAAEKVGVSVKTVKRSASVRKNGAPETIEAVKKGKLSVNAADKISRQPKEKQASLVKAAGEAKKPKSAAQLKANKYRRAQKAEAKRQLELDQSRTAAQATAEHFATSPGAEDNPQAVSEEVLHSNLEGSQHEHEHEHELQLFARTLIEKFEGSLPQLLTGLDTFSNTATAEAIRKIWN